MTTPRISFEYSFGEQPLLEDLKDIWCNTEESDDKYFDVKMIPLLKKIQLSLIAIKQHPRTAGFFLFVCIILICFVSFIINLPIGLHSFNEDFDCGYKNIFGVKKIRPQYETCGGFYNGKALIIDNYRKFCINVFNDEIPRYECIGK